ncbi:MAG: FAD-binding oxidoreductase [Alistipes sp.]|nr:FAD-binding oxidoreductase [Alistipes sp.]
MEELYEGRPYWLIKNRLWDYHKPLQNDIKTRVAVIGAGITGTLVAHALSCSGIECCIIDKREPACGSSCASTALLQYEIDMPLYRMARIMPEADAVTAYRSCLYAIDKLETLFREAKIDAGFRRVPSIFYADNRKGLKLIRKEYEIRKRYDLPVEFLDRNELKSIMGIEGRGALANTASAQIDTYRATTELLKHDIKCHNLPLYTHTEITRWNRRDDGYTLVTSDGHRIECEYVVVATGFEAGKFLPRKLMRLTSTYAIISQPVAEKYLWKEHCLIWQTRNPYLYIRTDNNNRIIVGGEDNPSNSASRRRSRLPRKARTLESKFNELYPDIPFITEMAWAGTFSSTRDSLPIIGSYKNDSRMLFALGYGGNGITFSMIAARIIARQIQGNPDPTAHVFSPNRRSL